MGGNIVDSFNGNIPFWNYSLGIVSTSNLEFAYSLCNADGFVETHSFQTNGAPIIPNSWNHVMVSHEYDETTNQHVDVAYINGTAYQTFTYASELRVCTDGTELIIGRAFSSRMDELLIFDRVLLASELYDIGNPQIDATASNVASTQIRFRHASGSIWPQLEPAVVEQLAFFAPFDSEPFTDMSANDRTFTTWGNGTVSLAEGRYGRANHHLLADDQVAFTVLKLVDGQIAGKLQSTQRYPTRFLRVPLCALR